MRDDVVTVNGQRVRYLDSGSSNDTIVLLHGLGGYAERWSGVIQEMAGTYRTVAPDMIGYGRSDKPVADYTPAFFVEFLEGFIQEMGLESPHLVGASLGGQVCAEFAASHPQDISRLVLVSPAGIMKHPTPALDAYIMAALYPRVSSVTHAMRIMDGCGREPKRDMVETFITNMRRPNAKMAFTSSLLCFKHSRSVTPTLRRISSPTLLVWGYDDPIIPVSYASRFRAAIPRCAFVGMEDCGHAPYVQYPERFSGIVKSFLSQDGADVAGG